MTAGCLTAWQADTPDVIARIAADAKRKWGDDAVGVEGLVYAVEGSFKAYDLEDLRAFD